MLDSIDWLGDVHLGRQFKTGVPLHRLGDREELMADEFVHRVSYPRASIHVQVGDLFDGFRVPAKWVLFAARVYRKAADLNPDTQYFVLRGNHDGSRDVEERSAMDLFKALMRGVPNVTVVTEPMAVNGLGLFPWDPFMTAEEVVQELDGQNYVIAVGHWDTGGYGATGNLIPYDSFCQSCSTVVTGHVHTPDRFRRGRFTVHVTGSMQPYSHAEDPEGKWYRTVTLEQLEQLDELENLNIRVLLREGEGLPEDLNCLSLVGKAWIDETPAGPEEEVNVADFDFFRVFTECMKEAEVSIETTQELWDIQEKADV